MPDLERHYCAFDSHLARARAPQVDTGSQTDAEQVSRRPVYQVEVKIVLQLRGVQDLERDLGDLSGWFPRRSEQLVTGETIAETMRQILSTAHQFYGGKSVRGSAAKV